MKTNFRIIAIFFIFMTSCLVYPRQTSAQQSNVNFQVFYDELSPYGQWIDYPNYGFVWIPDAGSDFVPYSTDGHWILTDYGWTWDSDYSWGWAPFHYGRWSFDDSFGWFWVPDNEWGPAWVSWREADGYYGWSPMEPGMSLIVSFSQNYDSSHNHWLFVRNSDFERTDINHYYINHSDQDRIVRNSTVINLTYVDNNRHSTYASGPSISQVQRVTGRTITPVIIRENNKPGQEISNGQLRIYRPQIVKGSNSNQKPAPTRITNMNDVKRGPVRNSSSQQINSNPVNNNQRVNPSNSVTPQNNSRQTDQKGIMPQNNYQQDPQRRNSVQSTPENKMTPVQPQKPASTDMNQPVRQRQFSSPQNNNNQSPQIRVDKQPNNNNQPTQHQNDNNQTNQQKNITPQNNTSQPVQQRSVTPQNNVTQPVQQPVVNQQNQNKQEQRPSSSSNIQNKPINNQGSNLNKQVRKGRQPNSVKKPNDNVQPKEVKPDADKKPN